MTLPSLMNTAGFADLIAAEVLGEKRLCRVQVSNGQAGVVGALGFGRHLGSPIYLIPAPSLAFSQIRINIE